MTLGILLRDDFQHISKLSNPMRKGSINSSSKKFSRAMSLKILLLTNKRDLPDCGFRDFTHPPPQPTKNAISSTPYIFSSLNLTLQQLLTNYNSLVSNETSHLPYRSESYETNSCHFAFVSCKFSFPYLLDLIAVSSFSPFEGKRDFQSFVFFVFVPAGF